MATLVTRWRGAAEGARRPVTYHPRVIDYYRGILDDPARQAAFQRAIQQAVRPGDVVVDLGCALGNFSVYACQAGAARVYSVEAKGIINIAREVVKVNGFERQVTFLRGRSTGIEVPEPADVVIFEDFSTTMISPEVVETLTDVKRRWLKPLGVLIPPRGRLWAAPVEDASGHRALDRFAWTADRVFGVDVTPTRRAAFSTHYSRHLKEGALLAKPTLVCEVDFARLTTAALNFEATVEVTRLAAVHGLLLWFDLDVGDDTLKMGPLHSETVWSQTLFPFSDPPLVQAGETVEIALAAGPLGNELVWRWSVGIGEVRRSENSVAVVGLMADEAGRWDPDRTPNLDSDLAIDHAVLSAVDGTRTLEEIAEVVSAQFPEKFDNDADCQRRVLTVIGRRQGLDHTTSGGLTG